MGLKSTQCWFEVERTLWSLNSGEASCACEQHVGGLANRKTAELKKIVPPESLEHVNQRRWWLYKVWAPSKIIIFHGAQIDTMLIWGRKNAMDKHVRFFGGRKTSKWKKVVSLESLVPSQNYNFSWGLNWLTWSRKNSMDAVCALHHISTSGLLALGYIVMYIII